MALDTRNKRAGAVNISSPWRGILPEPDGSVGQADRQTIAFMSASILAQTPGGFQVAWIVSANSMIQTGMGVIG